MGELHEDAMPPINDIKQKKLKTLDLVKRSIENISLLKNLTKLQTLGIVATKISDINLLQNGRQLKAIISLQTD